MLFAIQALRNSILPPSFRSLISRYLVPFPNDDVNRIESPPVTSSHSTWFCRQKFLGLVSGIVSVITLGVHLAGTVSVNYQCDRLEIIMKILSPLRFLVDLPRL